MSSATTDWRLLLSEDERKINVGRFYKVLELFNQPSVYIFQISKQLEIDFHNCANSKDEYNQLIETKLRELTNKIQRSVQIQQQQQAQGNAASSQQPQVVQQQPQQAQTLLVQRLQNSQSQQLQQQILTQTLQQQQQLVPSRQQQQQAQTQRILLQQQRPQPQVAQQQSQQVQTLIPQQLLNSQSQKLQQQIPIQTLQQQQQPIPSPQQQQAQTQRILLQQQQPTSSHSQSITTNTNSTSTFTKFTITAIAATNSDTDSSTTATSGCSATTTTTTDAKECCAIAATSSRSTTIATSTNLSISTINKFTITAIAAATGSFFTTTAASTNPKIPITTATPGSYTTIDKKEALEMIRQIDDKIRKKKIQYHKINHSEEDKKQIRIKLHMLAQMYKKVDEILPYFWHYTKSSKGTHHLLGMKYIIEDQFKALSFGKYLLKLNFVENLFQQFRKYFVFVGCRKRGVEDTSGLMNFNLFVTPQQPQQPQQPQPNVNSLFMPPINSILPNSLVFPNMPSTYGSLFIPIKKHQSSVDQNVPRSNKRRRTKSNSIDNTADSTQNISTEILANIIADLIVIPHDTKPTSSEAQESNKGGDTTEDYHTGTQLLIN
ncbi:10775_t:CDS:2 [Dentiscutata heterogama]|uniref:10775_t:CDS:1 n=1 Tax=Dentiscutata heterogama TaxID=1316150 RepID=A0ACA9LW13_9GLOM|nr:10775_t:CDS:2 [Dentiscutata heterogama]